MKKAYYTLGLLPVLLFLWISVSYQNPSFQKFDQYFSDLLYGREWLIFFHYIGETIFVIIVTVCLMLFLWLRERNYRAMLFVVFSIAGGTAVNQILKRIYQRPRPEIEMQLDSYSFPSGHSMMGIIYLFTVAFIVNELIASKSKRVIIWIVATILFLLIGMSRVAESRHFSTDVLGGWSLGLFWFTLCVIWYKWRENYFKK
jgi:undecaprenyl-diphosphatase